MLTKKYGKGLKGKPLVPFTHIHKHIHICLIICNFFWINLYVNYSFKTKTLYVIYLILQNIINFNNLIYGFLQSFFNPCYHYLQKKNFNIYFFFKQKHQHIRLSLINKLDFDPRLESGFVFEIKYKFLMNFYIRV